MAEVPVRHLEATQPPSAGEETTELQRLLDLSKALDEEKDEINRKARENDERKAEVLKKIKEIRLKDTDTKIPESIIIAFVEALVKANRYFDLKQYLREHRCFEELNDDRNNICDILCEKIEKEGQFGNDEIEILFAVQVVRRELGVESNRRRRAEYEKRFNGRDMQYLSTRQNLTSEEQKELLAYMHPNFHKHDYKVTDVYAQSSPILELAYQMREKDYVIDKKPEEELQKIKINNPGFYDDYFIYKKEPTDPMEYSDDTVALTNVPFYTATCEIDKLLMDYGEVICIRQERVRNPQSGKKCQVVFVTFEDSAAAKRALAKESLMVDENLIEITTPRSASTWLKPKVVRTISNFESALEKYDELRSKYQKQLCEVKDVCSADCAGEEGISDLCEVKDVCSAECAGEEGISIRKRKRALPSKNEGEALASSDGYLAVQ